MSETASQPVGFNAPGEIGSTPPKSITAFTNVAGNPSGNIVVINRYYDGQGQLASESVPHRLALPVPGAFVGSASSDWTGNSSPKTSYTYDALKRPVTKVQPDGSSTFTSNYNGWGTTGTDENGHAKATTVDVLGRVVQVEELPGVSGNPPNLTTYAYNDAGLTVTVTDAGGNVTTTLTDSLGRKVSQTDPDLGHWIITYPATPTVATPLWLPASQTDAKSNVLSFTYDKLDRVLTRKAGTLLLASYTYDDPAVAFGQGRRTKLTDAAGTVVSTSYDQRGRPVSVARTIGSNVYTLSTTYDELDRPLTMTYPNLDVVNYVYGDHGLPIHLILNGTYFLVKGALYNALGKIRTLPLGNGLSTSYQYDGVDHQGAVPNRWYGLPYQIVTGSVQNLTFGSYDLVGNPASLTYADHTHETITFGYNQLDELTGMTGPVSETYAYDQTGSATFDIGNLKTKNAASYTYPGTKSPSGTAVHTPASISGVGSYSYDANGNRLADSSYNYTYDAENRLTSVTVSVFNPLQNIYDGDGVRVTRVANGTTTNFVGDLYTVDPTTLVPTVYFSFNGMLVAMRSGSPSTISYLHHDQLGSLVSATDALGTTELGSARYLPYGGLRLSTGSLPTDRLFTGQIRDLGDDRFYFFKARYYDATIGKFQAADRMVPGAGSPRGLNRYAYGFNNPMRFVDPSGHDPLDNSWVTAFENAHGGTAPNDRDRQDRLLSLVIQGEGPGGAWSSRDWSNLANNRDYYYSRQFADSHRMPGETGTAQLVRYANSLSSWYAPNESAEYVRGLALLFGGVRYSGSPYFVTHPDFGYLDLDPSGLKPEFREPSGPGDNQSHHYAGFLFYGFTNGATFGLIGNALREFAQGGWTVAGMDQADVALGTVAARDGQSLYALMGLGVASNLSVLSDIMGADLLAQ